MYLFYITLVLLNCLYDMGDFHTVVVTLNTCECEKKNLK
jgi:hypothetical protein